MFLFRVFFGFTRKVQAKEKYVCEFVEVALQDLELQQTVGNLGKRHEGRLIGQICFVSI